MEVILVIVGGLISAGTSFLVTWVILKRESKQWYREKRLQFLQDRRANLERVMPDILRLIVAFANARTAGDIGMDNFESRLLLSEKWLKITYLPSDVRDKVYELGQKNDAITGKDLADFTGLLRKTLEDIDTQIEELLQTGAKA